MTNDSGLVVVFISACDKYVREGTKRKNQLGAGSMDPGHAVCSASFNYRKDKEKFQQMIELELIPDVKGCNPLTDECLRNCFKEEVKESREVATSESIDRIFEFQL